LGATSRAAGGTPGSIAGVAILLIAFLPALRVFADPLVGLVSLTLVLVALIGRVRLPGGMPGAFAAVLAGAGIFWLRAAGGWGPAPATSYPALPGLPWPTLAWPRPLALSGRICRSPCHLPSRP